jgi:hypothetical protein
MQIGWRQLPHPQRWCCLIIVKIVLLWGNTKTFALRIKQEQACHIKRLNKRLSLLTILLQ